MRALLADPAENRWLAAYRLVRSAGYDLAAIRGPLLMLLKPLLPLTRGRVRARVCELYAPLLDSRPVRPADRDALRRLAQVASESAEVLVRLASKEKLLGDLDPAARHAEAALSDLRRRKGGQPLLEAMAVYNLVWISRNRADFTRRTQLLDLYRDRMAHIGFNWAAWLGLDEVLMALAVGDLAAAREQLDSPYFGFARTRTAHPRYQLDDDVVRA